MSLVWYIIASEDYSICEAASNKTFTRNPCLIFFWLYVFLLQVEDEQDELSQSVFEEVEMNIKTRPKSKT